MPKAETLINHSPHTEKSSSPSSQNPEQIRPYVPTFNIESAAFAATFIDLHSTSLTQHDIEPLSEALTDQIWALAGTRTKQDHRLREERQINGLRELSEICKLPDDRYQKWAKKQLAPVRRFVTFGKMLHEQEVQGESGDTTSLLDGMITLAEERLKKARDKVTRARR